MILTLTDNLTFYREKLCYGCPTKYAVYVVRT
jgi:hypothetical protein